MPMIIVAASIVVGAGIIGYVLAILIGPRLGINTRDLPAKRLRLLWLMLAAMLGISIFVAWAITHGEATLGIGVSVAVVIMPQFVLIAVQIRRSQRRAAEDRARRNAVVEK